MIDLSRLERKLEGREPGLMDARSQYAVLVPLVERPEGVHLLYEVRAAGLRRQPGEVCFPGGRMEPGETAEACALRETWEELAIPPAAVHVVGRLDFIAHRANFILYPVLARVQAQAVEHIAPNPDEVDETFQVPLDHLLHTAPQEYCYTMQPAPPENFPYETVGIPRDYRWQQGRESVPVYPWAGHAIWGITGRITRHLVHQLAGAEE